MKNDLMHFSEAAQSKYYGHSPSEIACNSGKKYKNCYGRNQ